MAATLCVKLLPKQGWLPLTQSVRHGSKAVTRHRKPMHIIKAKIMAVTEYIPPAQPPPRGAFPTQTSAGLENHPLMLILRRNLETMFQECKMVVVAQNNSCNAEDMMILKYKLHKHGISVKFFSNQVMRSFLKDSIYANMAPLFVGQTVLFVSKEPKVKEMLTTLRSSPQMTVLGACIDNTLLSAQGLLSYSRLPTMAVVQGELVSGLTMLTSHTASMLQRQPAHLSALLQQYVKQQSSDNSAEEAT